MTEQTDQMFTVPFDPTEDQWDGLTRQLIMWMDMGGRPTPRSLFDHLKRSGYEIPDWLRNEPDMKNLDHVPPKGTRAVLIYKAMLLGYKAYYESIVETPTQLPPSLAVKPNIPLDKQTLEQLYLEKAYWEEQVNTATGAASAHATNSFRKGCEVWINKRENEHGERS